MSNRIRKVILTVFLLAIFGSPVLRAQDVFPVSPLPHCDLPDRDTIRLRSQMTDTVAVPVVTLPVAFRNLAENVLTDSIGLLSPFWEKLRLLRAKNATGDTLHIVHVGDSHIRGHIFPRTAGEGMQRAFGALTTTDVGINGAFCFTFVRPDRIRQITGLRPDLLILSFGTNESHNRRYDARAHYRQMDELVRLLRDSLPDVPILMTTPPGSYESFRRRGQRRTYSINLRTPLAVETIRHYADDNGLAVWDMYNILGGARRACLNWWEAGLMRPDHVHYLPDGYVLQGELLCQALLRAYNDYVR